jgi:D-alanyl-lipoteichoic acid acyltransferase DltB (MBOAT superfamily)
MIFNSVTYFIFLSAVIFLYWTLPRLPRLWLIFISSSIFYGFWRPEFLLVMLLSASTDYFVALRMDNEQEQRKRTIWLGLSLFVNIGMLCYFKYLIFIMGNLAYGLNFFGIKFQMPILEIMLPLGISFYTFETISYVVDVYRRFIPAQKSFLMYACFVTFFPKLVAGPILRAAEMLPQISERPIFRLDTFVSGLRRIIFGLFIKVVLADNISTYVDDGFLQPIDSLSALDVITLAFLFGFQIYFDFSAYSSIAIGSARLMGIHVPENFNFPYISSSPREFWRRWHISLSSWIRDYLYLPLQGLKVRHRSSGGLPVDIGEEKGTRHPLVALFLTWAIMGLWHGANWTFVIWGLYHATLIAMYRLTEKHTLFLPQILRSLGGWMLTLFLVMLGWIPFRAKSVEDTFSMLSKLFSLHDYSWLGMRENTYIVAALLFLFYIITYAVHEFGKSWFKKNNVTFLIVNTFMMSIVISLVFVFLRPISQFIYFQF